MEVCGYGEIGAMPLGAGRVSGMWLCGSDGPMPVGIGYWFYGFFHTLCG